MIRALAPEEGIVNSPCKKISLIEDKEIFRMNDLVTWKSSLKVLSSATAND
jgi:hypothetical protein